MQLKRILYFDKFYRFGSTGKGHVFEDMECSHYMKDFHQSTGMFRHPKAK